MKNFKKRLLIFVLLFSSYTLSSAEVIKIPPIVIKEKQENRPNETANILSNLKKAITKNKKFHKISKEEEAKEILKRLKESIPTPPPHLSSYKTKKDTTKKHIYKKKSKNKITKKAIKKKSKNKIIKKAIKKKSKNKIIKKAVKKKSKNKIIKKAVKKKTIKTRVKIIKKTPQKQLSYIKDTTSKPTEPIGFVKTLGVVGKSEVYEANDLTIDKREEISNDGVVDISTATTETEDLKHLPFVKPLEVVEVTEPFEASEAKRYQLDKR